MGVTRIVAGSSGEWRTILATCLRPYASKRDGLARIHDVARVERALDHPHQIDRLAVLLREDIELVPADAVLAGARAAHRDRAHAHVFRQRLGLCALRGIGGVEQDDEMEVAIT